jgi:hypothetical protein
MALIARNKRIVIGGGRHLSALKVSTWCYLFLPRALDFYFGEPCGIVGIAHGKNPAGGDLGAEHFARLIGLTPSRYPAEWARYGDAAGPIRNRAMLLDYMPDIVVTFPGIVGTLNLIENADAFGIPIVTINGVFTP